MNQAKHTKKHPKQKQNPQKENPKQNPSFTSLKFGELHDSHPTC